MEKICMRYVNKNGDTCLVMVDDNDEIYEINMDKHTVTQITPMGCLEDLFGEIDFEQDDLYVLDSHYDSFIKYVFEGKDDMDATLIGNLIKNTTVLK